MSSPFAILNSNLRFETAPQDVRKRFWGMAYPTLFPAGTDLYRFLSPQAWNLGMVSSGMVDDPFFPGNKVVSDSWIDHQTFAEIRRAAHDSDLPISTVAQSGLGVNYRWSPSMREFGWVKLRYPVYGLVGASNRRLFSPSLSGGGIQQIWMPNLTTDIAVPIGRAPMEALVPSFAGTGKSPFRGVLPWM